jgi:hypothetical protein
MRNAAHSPNSNGYVAGNDVSLFFVPYDGGVSNIRFRRLPEKTRHEACFRKLGPG